MAVEKTDDETAQILTKQENPNKTTIGLITLIGLKLDLGGRFGYFYFFCSGAEEKEEASEEVVRGSVLMKNRVKGGGFSEEEAWEGEGRWGNVCGEGGG